MRLGACEPATKERTASTWPCGQTSGKPARVARRERGAQRRRRSQAAQPWRCCSSPAARLLTLDLVVQLRRQRCNAADGREVAAGGQRGCGLRPVHARKDLNGKHAHKHRDERAKPVDQRHAEPALRHLRQRRHGRRPWARLLGARLRRRLLRGGPWRRRGRCRLRGLRRRLGRRLGRLRLPWLRRRLRRLELLDHAFRVLRRTRLVSRQRRAHPLRAPRVAALEPRGVLRRLRNLLQRHAASSSLLRDALRPSCVSAVAVHARHRGRAEARGLLRAAKGEERTRVSCAE